MPESLPEAPPEPCRATPRMVAVLDRRMELARLIELLVRERSPGTLVRAFDDAEEARRWVADADAPVVVFADVEAHGGADPALTAAWRSRVGAVTLALLAADEDGQQCAGAQPKPARLEAWRSCIDAVLAAPGAWHTAEQWRTPPGPRS